METKEEIYAAQAELCCSVCEGKIVIGIPRGSVKEKDNKLIEMPSMSDPRWEIIISSCRCKND